MKKEEKPVSNEFDWKSFSPKLPNGREKFDQAVKFLASKNGLMDWTDDLLAGASIEEVASVHLLKDMMTQGWELKFSKAGYSIKAKENPGKEATKKGHEFHRDEAMEDPSVRQFIRTMETRKLGPKGWCSVYDLMRDGNELADALQGISEVKDVKDRMQVLGEVISPYLQLVRADQECEHTGYKLQEIWRYFRYTWTNQHLSSPGRQLNILIRDSGAEFHPVVGIAALSSPVIAQKKRDTAIGWQREQVFDDIFRSPHKEWAEVFLRTVDEFYNSIFVDDLINTKIFHPFDLEFPSKEKIKELKEHSEKFKQMHYEQMREQKIKPTTDWESEARTFLFRSKRCTMLADLLEIKLAFKDASFDSPTKKALKRAFINELDSSMEDSDIEKILSDPKLRSTLLSKDFEKAVWKVFHRIKSERVGINLMDISVCGAIEPYSTLLGGKLVCMLLCSSEIGDFYYQAYGKAESVIASSLKGEPVVREPLLAGMCTTSLYGANSAKSDGTGNSQKKEKPKSSQYSRISIPAWVMESRGSFHNKISEVLKGKVLKEKFENRLKEFSPQRGPNAGELDYQATADFIRDLKRVSGSLPKGVKTNLIKLIGELEEKVEYEFLGCSEGWGSFHMGRDTAKALKLMIKDRNETRVNSQFGEGISPKMRMLSQGIQSLGLNPSEFLKHRKPREIFLIKLFKNFRRFCLGLDPKPKPILSAKDHRKVTRKIANYWKWRWLLKRIENQDVIERLRIHDSKGYPVEHGAKAPLPREIPEDDLFPEY